MDHGKYIFIQHVIIVNEMAFGIVMLSVEVVGSPRCPQEIRKPCFIYVAQENEDKPGETDRFAKIDSNTDVNRKDMQQLCRFCPLS